MNYAGSFDATLAADGPQAQTLRLDAPPAHAPVDSIVVSDAHLLFNADFKRSGVDLILSGQDHELVLHDYFKGQKRAALASPDGAHLTGDIVNALTGHVQYSQAGGGTAAGQVIGHVSKLSGTATATRNGVSIILNNGDNVEKGDVVQSGSDSILGITFVDGTVFGLSSNARMVLNEMIYDPNGSNNSSLISLVAGTISFVAGQTAKHGDMKIDTPVATMGIRGTAVLVQIDFLVAGQGDTPDAKFQVLVEPDGTTGSYILYDKTTLTPIATVDQAGQQINISHGVVSTSNEPLPPDVQKLINDVFSLKFTSNPQSFDHFTDIGIPSPLQTIRLANGGEFVPPNFFNKTVDGSTTQSNSPEFLINIFFKTIDVSSVADKPNFAIADQVKIFDSNQSETITPYVSGTAAILSVVGPSNVPEGVNLAKLLLVDPVTGAVSYNPASFSFLGINQKVVFTIGFDSRIGSEIFHETLTVTIDGVSPVFAGNTASSANEDGLVTLGATLEGGLGVTIAGLAHDLSDFSGGRYDPVKGTWTGTVAEFNALKFHAGEEGIQHLTVTATTSGASTTESYTLTVNPIQENPVFAGKTAATASEEGALVTLGATVAPHDADDGPISVTITGLAHDLKSFNGGKYNSETGTWTGTSAEFNALTFHTGEDGIQNLTIKATTTGAEAGSTTENFTLTVTAIHEDPVFAGKTAATADEEGGLVTLGATVAPHDADDGPISVTITGLAHDLTNFSGGNYIAGTGTWTGTAEQFNALTFHAGEDGIQSLTITATTTGAEAGSATESFTLTVQPDNDATIVLTGLNADHNAVQGQQITATVTDADAPSQSEITFTWKVNGVAVGTKGNTYTPTEADEGKPISVAVSFTDTHGFVETGSKSAGTVQEVAGGDLVATLDSAIAKEGVAINVVEVTDGGTRVTTGLSFAWQTSSDNGQHWTTVGQTRSYTPGEGDEGKVMQLVVTYTEATGVETATYNLGTPTDLVATLDSTSAQQGSPIHITGVKDGGSTVTKGLSYAWQTSSDGGQHWSTVGSNANYTPVSGDAGKMLQVVVTYVDSGEHESTTDSLGIVASATHWKGGTHSWDIAGQWTPSGVPGSSDNAVVDATGQYTLTIDQASAAHSLIENGTGATIEIAKGATLTLGGDLTIDAGTFKVDDGATLKDIAASAIVTGAFSDSGTVEAAGGTLEIASTAISGSGKFKIDAGATLQLDHADSLDVTFAGAGTLILKDPAHFKGIISDTGGSLTSADVVDVAGFDTSASVKYSGTTSGGTVTVSEAGHTSVVLNVGTNSTHWSAPVSDGHGGILIHDPPASSPTPVVMHDPGPAPIDTVVASAPNQTLSGSAANENFVFNFAEVGHATVADFHPETDTLQFSQQIFADAMAVFSATQDDGHGNSVITIDSHDTITLTSVSKAQLHASDFHTV